MPNHCTNILRITCNSDDDAAQVLEIMTQPRPEYGPEEPQVTFAKLLPMPEILRRVRADFGREPLMVDNGDGGWREPTDEERAEIEATGATDWYEWACKHWGTKWDAYATRSAYRFGPHCNQVQLEFQTAWSPPEPVVSALLDRFKCRIKGVWHEEGGEFGAIEGVSA